MAGQHWRVRTDNVSCEAWIMRGVRQQPAVGEWLQELMSLSLVKQFRLTAKHIAGARNVVADALSRCHWDAFMEYGVVSKYSMDWSRNDLCTYVYLL